MTASEQVDRPLAQIQEKAENLLEHVVTRQTRSDGLDGAQAKSARRLIKQIYKLAASKGDSV